MRVAQTEILLVVSAVSQRDRSAGAKAKQAGSTGIRCEGVDRLAHSGTAAKEHKRRNGISEQARIRTGKTGF